MKTLHNFCLEESFPKQEMDNICLTGGSLNLGNLSSAVDSQLQSKCVDDYAGIQIEVQEDNALSIL